MKRVRSIFEIFTVFLLIILASFLLLSWQSTANLKASLIQTAQLQTKYAATLLEQRGKRLKLKQMVFYMEKICRISMRQLKTTMFMNMYSKLIK